MDLERGSILHVATDLGNLDTVKLLVEKGKIKESMGDRWKITPIHVAAAKNRLEILKYLLENDGNQDIEDIFGNTPLGWAIFCKADECTAYLKSLNAREKEFVVPPPPPTDDEIEVGKSNMAFSMNHERTETTVV
jgi:ankyrin repeat protein